MKAGDVLPELAIPVTRSLVVATAIASRDFQDVHHDPALAAERGSPDIFMNILTTNGLVDRFVTSWAGPTAVVKRIRIRLGAPNYPGDMMTLTGSVTAVQAHRATVEVQGTNALGVHVSGLVEVQL